MFVICLTGSIALHLSTVCRTVPVQVAVDTGSPRVEGHRSSPVAAEVVLEPCRTLRHHQEEHSYRNRRVHILGLALAGSIVELRRWEVLLVHLRTVLG